jgi:uncharacterized protein YfaS (alpha-2-macroglobulin family)
MVSTVRQLLRRREAFWGLFLTGFLIYGLITLVRSETPHGRLVGRVVAQETGMPLPNAEIYLTRRETRERYTTDKNGIFKIPSLPKGHYTVSAYTQAHSLENGEFILKEGETKEVALALRPHSPFLSLIHPQAIYTTGEKIRIGVRGFMERDDLQISVHRVQMNSNMTLPPGTLISFIDDMRYGWWRSHEEWQRTRRQLGDAIQTLSETVSPITGRDIEGVFLQYLPFPLSEPGIYLMEIAAGSLNQVALVVITDIGLVTKRSGDGILHVWATNLSTGDPVPNVQVEAWTNTRTQGQTNPFMLSGNRTGTDGMVRLSMRNARSGSDRSYVLAYKDNSRQPVAWLSLWSEETKAKTDSLLTGAIYSERPVYRPGHTVHYKGILRLKTKQGYTLLPANTPAEILIRDPDNNLIQRAQTKISSTGSFTGSLQINEEGKTGIYSIEAQVVNQRLTGSFNVAAYRKPTFRVILSSTRKFITPSDSMRVELNARYYFGMPAGNAKVSYYVYRAPLYDWGPVSEEEDYGDESSEYIDYGQFVLNGETMTREDGRAVIYLNPADFPDNGDESPYWSNPDYRITVQAYVEASGYEYAEGKTQFDLVQSDWKLQVTTEPPFGAPNHPVELKVSVKDRASGTPQQTTVRWRAGLVNWRGNRMETDWQVSNQTLQTGANGEGTATFTPNRAGDWQVELETQDSRGNRTTVREWVLVSMEGEAFSRPASAPALQVMTDKKTYMPGERAKVAVRSPKTDAWVWITLEGDRLFGSKLVQLRQGVVTVEFPISAESVPSAYVSACMVHKKQFTRQTLPLKIGADRQQLKIEIQTDKPRYEPRETARINLQVSGADGRPVQAELSLAVVDEAIYAIREDNPTALYNAFYARRPNRVQTDYSFPWLALQGDKGEAETVRRYFPDTALWLPNLMTDARGQASASLTVPDTLTQWRITAQGHTIDTKVGYGKALFTCAKEFAVRLSVPPVLVEGDIVTVSAVVSNNGTQNRRATVELLVAGKPVESSSVSVAAGRSETVEWRYEAGGANPALPLQVRAHSEDGQSDAEEKNIAILPYATEKIISRNVSFGAGERQVNFQSPPNLIPASSRLQVRAAPSLFSQIAGSLDYLAGYPYGCTEQTMSRFLPSLMVMRVLRERNLPLPSLSSEVPKMVDAGVSRLYRFQHHDGGWGWWEEDPSDLWMTAYVMRGLSVARASGVAVNAEVYRAGASALERLIREEWKKPPTNWDNYCFALYALASANGDLPTTTLPPRTPNEAPTLQRMIPPTDKLSAYGKALLILALQKWNALTLQPGLVNSLQNEARSDATGVYWTPGRQNKERAWHSGWNNPSEVTAWACLALMQVSAQSAQSMEPAIRWLLSQRQADGWYSTKDTAVVLEAMLSYAEVVETPSRDRAGRLRVLLNGQPAGEILFDNRSVIMPEAVLDVPLNALTTGSNTVSLQLEGNFRVYAAVVFKQSIRVPEQSGEVISGGQQLERRYSVVHSINRTNRGIQIDERPLRSGESVPAGSLIRVKLRIEGITNLGLSHLILEDPLPSGCRPSEAKLPSESDSYEYEGYTYTSEARDDRMIAYFRSTIGDEIEYEYLMRAEVPGEYRILPPRLWTMYSGFRVHGSGFRLNIRP